MTGPDAIRALVYRWAEAVHDGDLAAVLAHHADDIVMFDVPPPHRGVRGLEEYRSTWPGFFEWQRSGALFEIVELESPPGTTWRSRTHCCGATSRRMRTPSSRLGFG